MPTSQFFNWKSKGIIAKPGASVFLVPWAGTKANTTFNTRAQNSAWLSAGLLQSSGNQNDEWTTDIWLDDGTYKVAMVYSKSTNYGIHSLQLNAVEKGTIDAYNAAGVDNQYAEVTGIAVTKGLYTFKDKMATKNASSTNYFGYLNSLAWIRTGA